MEYLGYFSFTLEDKFDFDFNSILYKDQNSFTFQLEDIKSIPQNRSALFISSSYNEVTRKEIFGNDTSVKEKITKISNIGALEKNLYELDLALGVYYDSAKKSLLISRDVFGLTPCYFIYSPNEGFVFSSDIKKLTKIKGCSLKIAPNNNFIADYLTPWKISYPTNSRTAYTNIHTILPGHYLIVNEEELCMKSYLDFKPERYWGQSEETKDTTFKSLFLSSITKLIAKESSIGAHLSGGLDSSSICCAIRHLYPELPFSTYHFDTDHYIGSISNDKKITQIVANKIAAKHKWVQADLAKSFEYTYAFIERLGQPSLMVSGANQSMLVKQEAIDDNVNLLLTGHGGDSVVGHGSEYIANLFEEKQWSSLRHLLGQSSTYASLIRPNLAWENLTSQQRSNLNFSTYVFQQLKRKKDFRYAIETLMSINHLHTWQDSFGQLFKWLVEKPTRSKFERQTFVHNEVIPDLEEVIYSFENTDLLSKYNGSLSPLYGYFTVKINEELSILDNSSGVTEYHPFFDKDLVEYCISVSSEEKYNNGFTRGPLRKGLSDILPEELKIRKDKHAFDLYSLHYTLAMYESCRANFLHDQSEVWHYANKVTFERAIGILKNSPSSTYRSAMKTFVLRVINLAIWLSLK